MPHVRMPAVAGTFYESRREDLHRQVRSHLRLGATLARQAGLREVPARHLVAAVAPHAGYVYSGTIAGAVFRLPEWPVRLILLGPNHTGRGAPAALATHDAWRTPLGDVPLDRELAAALLAASADLTEDDDAHAQEHSLEVELPFLQVMAPRFRFVPIAIGEPDLPLCLRVGQAVARVLRESREPVALVVSTDLNHYLPREKNRPRDDRAVDAVLRRDPDELFDRVLNRERISMCGVLPVTALLSAVRELGAVEATLVAQGDSGDAFGDLRRVVGYASFLFTREPDATRSR